MTHMALSSTLGEHVEATEQYTFPNKIGRILLQALEDNMGRNGLNAVLNLARLSHFVGHYPSANFEPGLSFAEMTALFTAIDEMYGPRGGRMIALRAGRTSFKYGIEDFGGLVSVADLALRIAPVNLRMRLGLEVLAEIFNRYTDQVVELYQNATSYFWVVERCGFCWERRAEYAVCTVTVGLLQEALYWVSGGRLFDLEEVACIALGDPQCVIQIGKARVPRSTVAD
jgi:predicted hydrocarbon binding protein